MSDSKNTIIGRFYAQCENNPHKNVILYGEESHYTTLTYEQINDASADFAASLRKHGIGKDNPVAIVMENSPLWLTGFLGIMRLGARCVPLNPALAQEELLTYLAHAEVRAIITSKPHADSLRGFSAEKNIPLITIDSQKSKGTSDEAEGRAPDEGPDISPRDIALISYTSGTTSAPKGVLLTHKNILANLDSIMELKIITSEDCLLAFLPFYHSYPLMVTVIIPLLTGAKLSFPVSSDTDEILRCIQLTNVTILPGVPQLFDLLAKSIQAKFDSLFFFSRFILKISLTCTSLIRRHTPFNPARLVLKDLHRKFSTSLRLMVSGGAPLNPRTALFLNRCGFTILQGYGLTETSPVVTFNLPDRWRPNSIGCPIPGVEVEIANPDKDTIGEIIVRGENVTGGYYKNEAAAKELLKDGWLYSGDLGYRDRDGFIYVTGRKNELIVLPSGKKIVPQELERFYLKTPYIKEMCVLMAKKPSGKEMLTAVIVPHYSEFIHKDISQVSDRIRWEIERLSRELPPYQRIKNYIITNKELPRTALGKIKRYEVARAHTAAEMPPDESPAAPLSPEDEELINSPICQKALEYLETELKKPVRLDDHLELDLGLDSLEQVGLFLGFKNISGVQPNELEFLTVFTVRDVLKKFKEVDSSGVAVDTSINWPELFQETPSEKIQSSCVLRLSFFARLFNAIFYALLKLISFCFFPLQTEGRENVPASGPCLICPNHASFLDGPMVAAALGLSAGMRTYFVGYAGYLRHPLIRWASNIFRLVPIEASSQLTESLKTCAYLLKQGKGVCFFPEGGRSISGKLKNFKRGAGILIKELDIPVLPVYIRGTHRAWPPFRKFPRPAKVTIVFAPPVTLADLEQNSDLNVDSYQNIVDNLRGILQTIQDRIDSK